MITIFYLFFEIIWNVILYFFLKKIVNKNGFFLNLYT